MPHRDIREVDAKTLLSSELHRFVDDHHSPRQRFVQVGPETDLAKLADGQSWLQDARLVVKPDMLFGRRSKLGLIALDVGWTEAKGWLESHRNRNVDVDGHAGQLTHFLVEPFVPHGSEYYLCFTSEREGDVLLFSSQGGVDIEDGWAEKVRELRIPVGETLSKEHIAELGATDEPGLAPTLVALHRLFQEAGLAYLEVNPLAFVDDRPVFIDTVATIDDDAPASCKRLWTWEALPEAFGTQRTAEEEHIRALDEKTGASLKFTLLNPEGRLWLLVSGGGASVIFADTVADLGAGKELANYGEYSGNPSLDETWDYARTILSIMTRTPHPHGKVLVIGGGIANFTDTAKTFAGIIKALHEQQEALRQGKVRIFVRRGGPNYKRALQLIRECGDAIGIPVEAYGPEAHMTDVCARAIAALTPEGAQ